MSGFAVGGTPSLKWLRSFEAAGRLGSFKAAAVELTVSPSTISHQIGDLESLLGVPLFARLPQGSVLTEEGVRYLAPQVRGFELLRSASPVIEEVVTELRIGAFPFLANEIIAPNLESLRCALQGKEVGLYTTTDLRTLTEISARKRLDVVIRYGNGNSGTRGGQKRIFAGLSALKLFDIALVPIQSTDSKHIDSLDELLAQPLIKVIGPFDGWAHWSSAHALDCPPEEFVLRTDSYHAAALAVERGDGICLGLLPYMRPWLQQRRVKMVERFATIIEEAAYLVYAPHNKGNRSILELHTWLAEILK